MRRGRCELFEEEVTVLTEAKKMRGQRFKKNWKKENFETHLSNLKKRNAFKTL